jgi:hypothetical protein
MHGWAKSNMRRAAALALIAGLWPGLANADSSSGSPISGGGPGLADSGWSRGRAIDPVQGLPYSVSCASTSFCVALDEYGFVATFDGTAWSPATMLFRGAVTKGYVDCPSTSFCLALREDGDAQVYDGSSWSRMSGPRHPVNAQSCASESFCVAVLSDQHATIFDGAKWRKPQRIKGIDSQLTSISCSTTSACVAVDLHGNASWFDGSTWSTAEHIGADIHDEMYAVSCASPTDCMAVYFSGFAYVWKAGDWKEIRRTPSRTVDDVSCPSKHVCTTAGQSGDVSTYDGTHWTEQRLTQAFTYLPSVSCATPDFCAALDTSTGQAFVRQHGTWTGYPYDLNQGHPTAMSCSLDAACAVVDLYGNAVLKTAEGWQPPTRVNPQQRDPELVDVSCTSASFCAALDTVGGVFMYDGSTWTTRQATGIQTPRGGISCASSTFCVVVGYEYVAVYDGTAWSEQHRVTEDPITAVDCASSSFCVVSDAGHHVLTYDGSTWSQSIIVDPNHMLTGVDCASEQMCVGVDDAGRATTYDGSSWSHPVRVSRSKPLSAINCPDERGCVAIDDSSAFVFDGSAWSSTGPVPKADHLVDLGCAKDDHCVVVDARGDAFTHTGPGWACLRE